MQKYKKQVSVYWFFNTNCIYVVKKIDNRLQERFLIGRQGNDNAKVSTRLIKIGN
jgi:hypothetical protein